MMTHDHLKTTTRGRNLKCFINQLQKKMTGLKGKPNYVMKNPCLSTDAVIDFTSSGPVGIKSFWHPLKKTVLHQDNSAPHFLSNKRD